jgi:glutathione S-transferase
MALNLKGIPYRTIWLSYPEIAPTLSARGFSTPAQGKRWTLPALEHPSPSNDQNISYSSNRPILISDSIAIAQFLDRTYPDRVQLFPKGTEALQEMFIEGFLEKIMSVSRPILIPAVANVIDEASFDFFMATREQVYGKPLEAMMVEGRERAEVFQKLREGYDSMASYVDKAATGSLWMGGEHPIFADLVLLAHLLWMKKVLTKEEWEMVQSWRDGRWEKMIAAAKDFTQVIF